MFLVNNNNVVRYKGKTLKIKSLVAIPSSCAGLPELHRPIVADEHQAHPNALLTRKDSDHPHTPSEGVRKPDRS